MFSIEAKVPKAETKAVKALLIKACNVFVCSEERVYSEIEEQTLDVLNSNEGYGILDVEFVMDNITKVVYPKFYTKCFVIRTDTFFHIKPMKMSNNPSESRINQHGELVIGIRYYFRDSKEAEKIVRCKNILVEGFIALDSPKNVYGVMCQLQKTESKWVLQNAYTYKPKYAKNIKYLID